MKKPLLTIGMIVKNEIRCIEKCLKALEPLRQAIPCELIIADTGSTDGTREIAAKYADILFDFEWINDFSAARNAVMERSSGQWYFTIDADEYLDEHIEPLTELLLHNPRAGELTVIAVVQRNYTSSDFEHGDYCDFFAQRILNMSSGARYTGTIHEMWDLPKVVPGTYLPKLILHHDGYVYQTPEDRLKKAERNLHLLYQELEKAPNDLRRLTQCIEASSVYPAAQIAYCTRAMQVLENDPSQVHNSFGASVCRYAVMYGLKQHVEQAKSWLAFAEQNCGNSIFFRLDVAYIMSFHCFETCKDYQQALKWADMYMSQWEDYQKEHYDRAALGVSALFFASQTDRFFVQLLMANCMIHLHDEEKAITILESADVMNPRISIDHKRMYFTLLGDMSENSRAQILAANVWKHVQQEAENGGPWEQQVKDAIRAHIGLQFAPPTSMKWRLYLHTSGDVGVAARIMNEEEPEKISNLISQTVDWLHMPMEVIVQIVRKDLPLPDSIFTLKREPLKSLAMFLAKQTILRKDLLRWANSHHMTQSIKQFQFYVDILVSLLVTEQWDDEAFEQGLCAEFIDCMEQYMPLYFSHTLLSEPEEWSVLPGICQLALWLSIGRNSLENNDELGYIRALHAGLEAAPVMKDMVNFLLEHKPKTATQRQLDELASQVQTVLSQYAPDDPTIVALKQSEAYQRVAPLLQQQRTLAPSNAPPVSPTSLEEALMGTREEIAASIRKNICRWGISQAKSRTDYWEKYPLWGKDENEVVVNLSYALSSHDADFRWLFGRLGDEQSRRILTAVVRSWRFFELEDLEQAKETQYDDYFDLSLLHCDENEVIADLGAFTGDTFLSYVKNYGSLTYRRYYAYEITKDSFDALAKVTAPYPRVVLRRKGVGDGPGVMALDTGADASANSLAANDNATETVEIVALDDDITEPLTLIKMDIEGAEQSALQGCARHIREDRPKLALSVYHNFEDLWKLPRMIEELAHGYRFYLRYHGGNLWPSEITLLAIPE